MSRQSTAAARNGFAFGVSLLAGLFSVFAFAPFGLFWLAPITLAVFFYAIVDSHLPKIAFLRGYGFGLGFFGAGIYWIYVSTGVYGTGGPLAGVLSTIAFVGFLALFPASMGWFFRRCFNSSHDRQLLIWLPIVWVMWEWIRSWIFTGFPWLTIGYSQTEFFVGAMAPVVGVFGISYAVALFAGAMTVLARGSAKARISSACVMLSVFGIAFLCSLPTWTTPVRSSISVALVQGNIAQEQKWLPEQQLPTLYTYSTETEKVWGTDLIVWPETAISMFYHEVVGDFIPALEEKALAEGSDIITGIIEYDFEQRRYFNSLITIGSTHEFFAKKHLVPFGEYLPLRGLLGDLLDILGVPLDDFKAGNPDKYILHAAGEAVGVSICYEDAFGNEIIRALPEATLLVNVSNDGWFGDTIAPHQHLQMAQMRARETERYLLRSTNTGITAIIDHHGQVISRAPQYTLYTLTGVAEPRTGMTPFSRFGNWPVISILSLLLLVGLTLHRRKSSE